MHRAQPSFVGIALGRLRFSILICCWVLGLSLVAQLAIWIVATYTDVRFETVKAAAPAPATIITGTPGHAQPEAAGIEAVHATAFQKAAEQAADPNRVPSKYDSMMGMAIRLSNGAGMLAIFMLLPLMILGVVLAAGSATPGVEHTVSSFTWAVILGLLVLPIAGIVGMPWRDGALFSYEALTSQLDAITSKTGSHSMTFYARFAMLPLACVIGTGMVALRFCAGIEAGLPKKEDMRLDPALEREAANISPTSLHGGRTGAALRAAASATQPPTTAAAAHPAGMTVPTAGVAPKRLI